MYSYLQQMNVRSDKTPSRRLRPDEALQRQIKIKIVNIITNGTTITMITTLMIARREDIVAVNEIARINKSSSPSILRQTSRSLKIVGLILKQAILPHPP